MTATVRDSVVVATRNRAPMLRRLLIALAEQTRTPDSFEVVIADDASTDETPAVCREFADRLPGLAIVTLPQACGGGSAANAAVERAHGDRLLITDDDCIPDRDWVERMSAALEKADLVAGAVASPKTPFGVRVFNTANFHGQAPTRRPGGAVLAAGANLGIRRSAFERCGKFDREIAQDTSLSLRARELGLRVTFAPEIVIVHATDRASFRVAWRYAVEHAAATVLLRRQHRELLRIPGLLFRPAMLVAVAPVAALRVVAGMLIHDRRPWRLLPELPFVYLLKVAWCLGASRGLRQAAALRTSLHNTHPSR